MQAVAYKWTMLLTPDDMPTDVEVLQRRILALADEREQLVKKIRVLNAFLSYQPTASTASPDPARDVGATGLADHA